MQHWYLGSVALMQQSGLVLEVIAFSAAMSAGAKGAQWLQVLGLLAVMLQQLVCSTGASVLLALMQQYGLVLDVFAFIAAVRADVKGAQWQQTLGLLAVMMLLLVFSTGASVLLALMQQYGSCSMSSLSALP
jgi:hypothetical protein